MKKVLFVAPHRPDRAPSQRFRFEQYFEYLTQNGYQCELSFFISEKDDKVFYGNGNYVGKFLILAKSIFIRLRDVMRANSYDIIFIQREAFMLGTTFFERLFSFSKAKLVFDFDDAIWLLQSSEFSSNNKLSWLKQPAKTSKIIKLSDVVFAGNQYLKEYALKFNKNTVIIPTTIDTTIYKPSFLKEPGKEICIGWSGSHTTLEHFSFAIPVLKRIKEKYGSKVVFAVMGDKNYKNAELDIQGIQWTKESEIKEVSRFDIGIMPLPDQEWTRGKCGFKGLLYMSLGIPTVMSAVGVNKEIIKDGINGFLATSEDEWVEKLSRLVEDHELRKRLGDGGREEVVKNYSVDSQKERYLQYFNNITEEK